MPGAFHLIPYGALPNRRHAVHDEEQQRRASVVDWLRSMNAHGVPESVPLVQPKRDGDRHDIELSDLKRRWLFTKCGIVTMTAAVGTLAVMCWTLYRMNRDLDAAQEMIAPHGGNVINTTIKMLTSTANTLDNVETISTSATPAMTQMLNHTQAMVDRLEHLLKHPSITFSLNDVVG